MQKDRHGRARPNRPHRAARKHGAFAAAILSEHLHPSYGIDACEKDDQAAFAERICKLGKLSWKTIHLADKHSVGSETISPNSIKTTKPDCIGGRPLLALRYSGKKPMVGFRDGRILHILWIERQFGELYDHG